MGLTLKKHMTSSNWDFFQSVLDIFQSPDLWRQFYVYFRFIPQGTGCGTWYILKTNKKINLQRHSWLQSNRLILSQGEDGINLSDRLC